MIKVENLLKKYGDNVAVDDLSFEVKEGQIYGFLGPNGAGKTTTMNIITGYLAATGGAVTINGFDILKQPEKAKKCIGYLPEIPPLYPDMTVWEYLRFVAELKKVPKKERKEQIQEIMQMVQISDVETRLIQNLSKGYKQRVGLAQAILGYPEIIILDEPMVGLDPKQIMEIRELIKKLSKEHTIILSSHILSEVSTLCDHIMIISHGKLVASDSPEGLQNLMKKSTEIEITVFGNQEKAAEILANMAYIQSYSFEKAAEEESVRIKIITQDNRDIRKELSVAFTGGGMPVLSMNKVEKTLEDIFLQLTDTEGQLENRDIDDAEEVWQSAEPEEEQQSVESGEAQPINESEEARQIAEPEEEQQLAESGEVQKIAEPEEEQQFTESEEEPQLVEIEDKQAEDLDRTLKEEEDMQDDSDL